MRLWVNKCIDERPVNEFENAYVFSIKREGSTIFTGLNDVWLMMGKKEIQPYLHFLVFKKESEIVGIVSYSIINPWNNKMYDIEYAKDDTITNYMKSYQKEIMGA